MTYAIYIYRVSNIFVSHWNKIQWELNSYWIQLGTALNLFIHVILITKDVTPEFEHKVSWLAKASIMNNVNFSLLHKYIKPWDLPVLYNTSAFAIWYWNRLLKNILIFHLMCKLLLDPLIGDKWLIV